MWWIIATLVLAAVVLMLVELLLTPGVGVAGFLSLGALGFSVWYAFDKFGSTAGWTTLVASIVILVVLIAIILRSRTWKKLELRTEIQSKMNSEFESLSVGDKGVTVTRLAPLGTARFGSVSCEVKSSDNNMVSSGTSVEVVAIEDNKVEVKPITE